MTFAFRPSGADWIEISEAGSVLPGAGEAGEDVVMSHAFVESLAPATRTVRGLFEVVEAEAPEDWIGWSIEDVEGVPTRVWQIAPE